MIKDSSGLWDLSLHVYCKLWPFVHSIWYVRFYSKKNFDPCVTYTTLDQPWRATNSSSISSNCDNSVNWNGWYRLLYNGMNVQMPESCVPASHCGTDAPLWITSAHPQVGDGVVSRTVCGNWNGNCCLFSPPSIQVKACVGNYYVYQFVKTGVCSLAYCAGNNSFAESFELFQ
uniref:UMOD/GP2/OIT3-like D8C domain-containing protein n=1 Tax=Denticeps clupeoides TaxID=299321 RepID=A0AAY3ZVK3_9TELE